MPGLCADELSPCSHRAHVLVGEAGKKATRSAPSRTGAFGGALPFHDLLQGAFWGVLSGPPWTYALLLF